MGQAKPLQQFKGHAPPLILGDAVVALTVSDIVQHAQMGKKGVVLIDEAHVSALRRQAVHPLPGDTDAAPGLIDQPGDGFEDQGLAGARRSHQGEKLARRHVEADIAQAKAPEAKAQGVDADHASLLRGRETTRTAKKNSRLSTMRITATGCEYVSP